MRVLSCLGLVAGMTLVPPLAAQSPTDSAAIRAAALDYIEGWFAGDADRMARALHPELVKRILVHDDVTGGDLVDGMGATRLIEGTRRKFGEQIPADQRRTDVTILDVTGRAASVKVDAGPWVDYMHLVKSGGRWQILNVLWERR
jgi:hypothetical protein